MTTTQPLKIDRSQVMCVYSGKPDRCMCGCSGTYKTASAHRDLRSKDRGYKVTDDEVSDRSVSIICNKIERAIASGVKPDINNGISPYIGVDVDGRRWFAYLVPTEAKSKGKKA